MQLSTLRQTVWHLLAPAMLLASPSAPWSVTETAKAVSFPLAAGGAAVGCSIPAHASQSYVRATP
jgi:hypothetical protein